MTDSVMQYTPYVKNFACENFANDPYFPLHENLISSIVHANLPQFANFSLGENSLTKFSPRTRIGEIGENFHMAKIFTYTVP